MSYIRKISLLLVALVIGLMNAPVQGQSTGNCEEAIGAAFIDVNNVRASIYNTGGLFWNHGTNVYNVPKGGPNNALFASGIWFGGQRNGQLRLAATRYSPWEFWAGPLGDDGSPPTDCEPFDRVWKLSKEDITTYETTGVSTPDLRDWPTGLGAPTLDANGDPIDLVDQPLASRVDRKINLAAGERPLLTGDQMLWWINNDRGNVHRDSETPPIGLEVHGSAFAFNLPGAIGNTTFYRYRVFYKAEAPLTNTYMSVFSDPDLGNASDDYVGSDPELGLGYVYNADADDDAAYGTNVPATGYDFFQGPLVDDNGLDDDNDGVADEAGERLGTSSFMYFVNGGGNTQGDPTSSTEYYNFMQARWGTGEFMTEGGDGLGFSNTVVNYAFPGKPGEFWSELNNDGQGHINTASDRRFMQSTGPWTMENGDEQEIVFGIVTSFGGDYLASVDKLKLDDRIAQAAFDLDFDLPSPPAAPQLSASTSDGAVLLEWNYRSTDNNFLDQYTDVDPLADPEDNDYVFEGYNIYQFQSTSDLEGEIIATYDVNNGITKVIDPNGDLTAYSAEGSDSGLQHFHRIGGLTNYKDYYFGVQGYAYNATSPAKVFKGPIQKQMNVNGAKDANGNPILTTSVSPSRVNATEGGTKLSDEAILAAVGSDVDFSTNFEADNPRQVVRDGIGQGVVEVKVVNPAKVKNATYSVEFHTVSIDDASKRFSTLSETGEFDSLPASEMALAAKSSSVDVMAYTIKRDGTVIFNGTEAAEALGRDLPLGPDVVTVDGMSFTIDGPSPGVASFDMLSNGAGALDPPACAAFGFQSFPLEGCAGGDRPSSGQQVNGGLWGFSHGGGDDASWTTWNSRVFRSGVEALGAYDWEIRFEGTTEQGWRRFSDEGDLMDVPFSLWRSGIGTPDDPSDDVRLIPAINDTGIQYSFGLDDGSDSPASGSENDPTTDWIYWIMPANTAAGDQGYQDFFFGPDPAGGEIMARTLLVCFNCGESAAEYPSSYPEDGTTIQIRTLKPNQDGDTFTFSTDGLGAVHDDEATATAALDLIGIVPNPYKGASNYEVSQLTDQVRFTNLPYQATIRVFTLSGTLIRVLEKNSADPMLSWDLATDDSLPIASGMYLIHVDTPLGSKVLKFGVIKKRVQLNAY